MSTRTNIIVKCGDSTIYLYRHHDGYLSETGADLYEKIRASVGDAEARLTPEGAADRFVRAVFAHFYEKQSYEKEPKRVYELTTELHGDIEHCYIVDFTSRFNTGPVSVRHAARPDGWHDTGLEVDDWAFTGKRHSLDSFREAINQDRRESNERITKLRASSKCYADMQDYPMLEAA